VLLHTVPVVLKQSSFQPLWFPPTHIASILVLSPSQAMLRRGYYRRCTALICRRWVCHGTPKCWYPLPKLHCHLEAHNTNTLLILYQHWQRYLIFKGMELLDFSISHYILISYTHCRIRAIHFYKTLYITIHTWHYGP
jgi:hypothetical protein